MTAPTFKKATDTDPGDATKYGAPDVKYAFDVLDATHATDRVQASAIETTSSNVQTDLDSKAPISHTHTSSDITDFSTAVSSNAAVAANTAKVTNATHTGDVTGSTALTITPGIIDNADINTSAAIALSKLATDPLARANHTGTQTASTISDYSSATATFTNKTIDADGAGNVITNIGSSEIKADIVTGLTEELSPTSGDMLLGVESGGALRKIDIGNLPTGGGGEANTASNVGTGFGIFKQKNGIDLEFDSLIGGTGITISDTTDDLTISHDAHTGDVTGSTALTIANSAVTNAKLANMAQNTIKGRITASTGAPEDLTAANVRTMINVEDGATADQSDAEIKTAYENNANTNAFTDADESKLDGIAAGANNYTHPNHTGDVTSTGDGATVIADNAVTLAMMAHGTDGNLITYDATGAPAFVATGTSGHVLTSNGAGAAPTFQAAAGGGSGVWEELDRTTLATTGDTITCNGSGSGFPARKYLLIQFRLIGSGTINCTSTFNNDGGSNYARRYSVNGATDTETPSTASFFWSSGFAGQISGYAFVTNFSSEEKPVIGESSSLVDGAATINTRRAFNDKWTNKVSQVTRVDFTNNSGGNYAADSEVIVLGHD